MMIWLVAFLLGLVLTVIMPMVLMNFITRTKMNLIEDDDDSDNDKAESKVKGVVGAVAKIALPALPVPFSCVINTS